jgi:hypothetical protein
MEVIKMKATPIFVSLFLITVISFSNAHSQQLAIYGCQCGPEKGTSPAIQIEADSLVLETIKSWDKRIWFFTSKTTPLKSLKDLKNDQIAAWGAELYEQVKQFYKAIGIPDTVSSVAILGTGNPIFSGMENPPQLFITWSGHESQLNGSIRIEFIRKRFKK